MFAETPTDEVKILPDGREILSSLIYVSIYPGSEGGELGQQVDGILVSVGPVVGFLDTLLVCGGKLAVVVQGSDTHSQLCHGMQTHWQPANDSKPTLEKSRQDILVKQLLNMLGQLSSFRKLFGELTRLGLSGNFAG